MEELHDISVSVITCSAGKEVWSNYGHSAIRVCEQGTGFDYTFNYGLFSFDTPNFIWRFCTGETDYCVGAFRTSAFLQEYIEENRQVTQQELNLTQQEALAIKNALIENCRPENRFYRYNFFYDNCATRVRNIVEQSVDETITYNVPAPYGNLRDVINFYTEDYPWTGFGISLLIGSKADQAASIREQMFAPEIMQQAFANATIGQNPAVKQTITLCEIDPSKETNHATVPGPQVCGYALVGLVCALGLAEYVKRRRFWSLDIVLSYILGIAGMVIAFLVLFSEHPATSPNWLLLWVNPLLLVYAIALCTKWRKKRAALVCSALWLIPELAGFVCSIAGVQYFHPAVILILFSMFLRSARNLLSLKKTKKA